MINRIKQFEKLAGGFFVSETGYGGQADNCAVQYGRAIRFRSLADKESFSNRSHNINIQDDEIWWESSGNSEGWSIVFDSCEEAKELFQRITGIKVKVKNYEKV